MNKMTDNSKINPTDFVKTLENDEKRKESLELIKYLVDTFGWEPKIWSEDTIAFGKYHYEYKSGRSGEFFIFGFAPREKKFSFYTPLYVEGHESLVKKIGIKKHGKSCLYFDSIHTINFDALKEFIELGIKFIENQEGYEILNDPGEE
jgi:hypothetical protein